MLFFLQCLRKGAAHPYTCGVQNTLLHPITKGIGGKEVGVNEVSVWARITIVACLHCESTIQSIKNNTVNNPIGSEVLFSEEFNMAKNFLLPSAKCRQDCLPCLHFFR